MFCKLLHESQDQNMALNVLYAPSLLNNGGDDACLPTHERLRIFQVLSLTGTIFPLVQPLSGVFHLCAGGRLTSGVHLIYRISYRGTSLIRSAHPPWDQHTVLGTGLL